MIHKDTQFLCDSRILHATLPAIHHWLPLGGGDWKSYYEITRINTCTGWRSSLQTGLCSGWLISQLLNVQPNRHLAVSFLCRYSLLVYIFTGVCLNDVANFSVAPHGAGAEIQNFASEQFVPQICRTHAKFSWRRPSKLGALGFWKYWYCTDGRTHGWRFDWFWQFRNQLGTDDY